VAGSVSDNAARLSTEQLDLFYAGQYIEKLDQLNRAPESDATRREQEAIVKVLSHAFRQERLKSFSEGWIVSWTLTGPRVRFLNSLAGQWPSLSAAEASEARRLVGLPETHLRLMLANDVDSWIGVVFMCGVIGSLVVTVFLRTAPVLRLCGIAIQRVDGRRAGRMVCLLRGVVVWSPLLLLWVGDYLVMAVFALGATYAMARPARGIPDLITRTHLVPR
jgi:hypothetical protein